MALIRVEKDSARKLIIKLRSDIPQFLERSAPDAEFYHWRESVLHALRDVFGNASAELGEFSAVRFELDAIQTLQAEQKMEQVLSSVSLQGGASHYYHARLHDAEEILLSFTVAL